jgi:hypothetical protein
MQYRYAENQNFEDYASGRVFYNQPGYPAFPVRLASEIFQRSLACWRVTNSRERCRIYDPVCGGAYWLAVLAYLHWEAIEALYASDIDPEAVSLAKQNLALITPAGLVQRTTEIERLLAAYQKESHSDALESAKKFRKQLDANLRSHRIDHQVFQADATDHQSMAYILEPGNADIILADVPYGWHSQWLGVNNELEMGQTPIWQMLEALHPLIKPGAVLSVATDKNQKVKHKKYRRLERFQLGKRRVFILEPQ